VLKVLFNKLPNSCYAQKSKPQKSYILDIIAVKQNSPYSQNFCTITIFHKWSSFKFILHTTGCFKNTSITSGMGSSYVDNKNRLY
jgi:hypothetical protein